MTDESLRRLHDRIDALARDVHTLELTTIKREGPLVSEIRDYQRKVDRMGDSILTRDEFRRIMEADEFRTFNKHDRYWAGALAFVQVTCAVATLLILLAHA